MGSESRTKGLMAENIFAEILMENNIDYQYVNTWYDFDVLGVKIDVKSARITHKISNKHRNNQSYSIGRYHFTEEQLAGKIWIAFFIRWDDKYIFAGLMKLKNESYKYLSIHQLREENLVNLNEFKQIVMK